MEERFVERRFEAIDRRQTEQEELLQKIFNEVGRNNTDIGVLKHEMKGARADITAIKSTQSDHGEILKEHSAALKDHSARLDRIEVAMATKEDISALKETQERQELMLKELLRRLPPRNEE